MSHFTLSRRIAGMAMLALGVLVASTGCSKKLTGVDAGYKTLEGRLNADARLIVWTDVPDTAVVWADLGNTGPPPPGSETNEDTLFARTPYLRSGANAVHAMVLDRTPASGFQFFRRAGNGGLQEILDHTVTADTKWLSSGWESYLLDDDRPSSYSPPTYQARGLLDGRVTTQSPLTNPVSRGSAPPTPTLRAQVIYDLRDTTYAVNTLNTIPAGTGVWIDIYQYTNAVTLDERRAAGLVNPVMPGSVKHFLVAYYPPSAAGVIRMSPFNPARAAENGAEVITYTKLVVGQTYFIRLTAVDESGNVKAWMRGEDYLHQMTDFYEYLTTGAISVKLPRG